jgi:NitT/TauT family transport system permease protein
MSETAAAPSATVPIAPASQPRGESRWWTVGRTAFPFLVVGAMWEVAAHLGIFPPRLFPPLEEVASALVRLTASGTLPHHVLDTLLRLFAGFICAAVAGVLIGFAMGHSRRAEDVLLPLVSMGAPIPGIAYAPLFLLWFGRAIDRPCCWSPSFPPFP